jgi:hypothetical protein
MEEAQRKVDQFYERSAELEDKDHLTFVGKKRVERCRILRPRVPIADGPATGGLSKAFL